MIVQADLFRAQEEQTVPMQGVWYPARFVSWEYMTSPTQGEMRRLIGELTVPPLAGWAIWKPLTTTFAGVRWVEGALKKTASSRYSSDLLLTTLRRSGLGDYLDNLCRALVERGTVLVTVYPYVHSPTQEMYWTADRIKKVHR